MTIAVSAITKAFLEEEPARRVLTLQAMLPAQRQLLFEDWAKVCSLTEVIDLIPFNKGFFHEMERVLCGSPRKNLPKSDRQFYVMPNRDYEPAPGMPRLVCQIDLPTRNNERRHQTIDRPTMLPVDRAMMALIHFGPHAMPSRNRGALIEITEDEFYVYRERQREKAREAEAAKLKAERDAADARLAAIEAKQVKAAEAAAEEKPKKSKARGSK